MKNYKGYDKKPYCEPHYPKTVASVVVDTPEMRRLKENTNYQSQVNLHTFSQHHMCFYSKTTLFFFEKRSKIFLIYRQWALLLTFFLIPPLLQLRKKSVNWTAVPGMPLLYLPGAALAW